MYPEHCKGYEILSEGCLQSRNLSKALRTLLEEAQVVLFSQEILIILESQERVCFRSLSA